MDLRCLKFPGEVYTNELKVALESTFPRHIAPTLMSALNLHEVPPEMEHHDHGISRFYHPAEVRSGTTVFYLRFTNDGELFKRLVFRRRSPEGRGSLPMVMARQDEANPFGFSCWKQGDKGNPHYVSLAFPGKTGEFEPVFIRIFNGSDLFFKVEARQFGETLVVSSNPIDEPPELF